MLWGWGARLCWQSPRIDEHTEWLSCRLVLRGMFLHSNETALDAPAHASSDGQPRGREQRLEAQLSRTSNATSVSDEGLGVAERHDVVFSRPIRNKSVLAVLTLRNGTISLAGTNTQGPRVRQVNISRCDRAVK